MLFLSALFYCMYHIFQGHHGLLAWGKLLKELSERQEYLKKIENNRLFLQHKVDLMGDKICLDLLEEEAKKKLGLTGKNEIMVLVENPKH